MRRARNRLLIWMLCASAFYSLPAPAQPVPVVTSVPMPGGPSAPWPLKNDCRAGPDSLNAPTSCPVLKFNGLSYWAFSYQSDDRQALGIVAYDAKGLIVKQWEKAGARGIWQIVVDTGARSVTFFGENSNTVTMPWSELLIPTVSLPGRNQWQLGVITNNTDSHVMFSFHVPKAGSAGVDALSHLTMVGVLIGGDGILSIDPQGRASGCANPEWRSEIQFGATVWEFYYNTGTTLDITINPDQQFVFTPNNAAQIVPLGQKFVCHQTS